MAGIYVAFFEQKSPGTILLRWFTRSLRIGGGGPILSIRRGLHGTNDTGCLADGVIEFEHGVKEDRWARSECHHRRKRDAAERPLRAECDWGQPLGGGPFRGLHLRYGAQVDNDWLRSRLDSTLLPRVWVGIRRAS